MNMNKIIAATVAACALTAVSASAAEAYVGGAFQSAYIASGTTVNDGWVFMPYAEITALAVGDTELPLTIGFWGNMDLEDNYDEAYEAGRFSEIDINVNFDIAKVAGLSDSLDMYIGYLEYDYPNGGRADNLIDFKVKGKCTLDPTFRVKYRFAGDSKEKCEFIPAIGHAFDLGNDVKFELGVDAVYIAQAPDSDLDDGFACVDYTAKLSWKQINVYGTYVEQVDDKVLPDGHFGYDSEWIVGAGFDFAF